ncbi:MAG: ATP synthase F1 subunit gamma [Clostridia bacterium]|nr:ATP synthase F1 subunit gamma [Clostridia bacterium]
MAQSTKLIKNRIKSVEGTKQITKAMELVATSKLRKAKENMERIQPYFQSLKSLAEDLMENNTDFSSPFCKGDESKSACHVVIAGDRGLAGGYNANLFRSLKVKEGDYIVPIGKKVCEYFAKKNVHILTYDYALAGKVRAGDCTRIAQLIANEYKAGKFGKVDVSYTKFVNVLTFLPETEALLPFVPDSEREKKAGVLTVYEPGVEAVFNQLIPQYVSGIIYGAVTSSVASELSSRRNAMQAANKNADEMIGDLTLKYNRSRQSAITQEITEIVAGSEI